MRCLPGVRLRRVPPRDARRDGGVDADNGAGIQTQPEPLRELRARDDGDDLPVGTGWRRALIVAPRSPPRSACSPSSRARRSCSSSTDGSTARDFSLVLPPTLGGGVDILVDVPTNAVTQVNAGLSRHLSLGTAVVPNPDSSIGYTDKGGLIISVGLSLPSTVTTQTPLGSINMDPFAKERRPWAQSVGPSRVLGPLMK